MVYLLTGLIPPVFLIGYMYKLDTIEKEPVSLLVKLFFLGGLTTIAASLLEELGVAILNVVHGNPWAVSYQALLYFLVVGVAEEGVKYFVLRRKTWYNRNFNYRFDAVVYSTIVSLGFAAFENVLYLTRFGLGIAPIRALTAIPMHCITGIFMGHYYGEAKLRERYHDWNMMYVFNVAAFVIPVLLHGFYDFAASLGDGLLSMLFLLYVVVLDVIAFLSVRHFARTDAPV